MTKIKHLAAACLAVALALPSAAQSYAAPKNSMGQPDLSGFWTNATITTLERPAQYGDRLVMNEEEVSKLRGGDPETRAMTINGQVRTSFLVEPGNGQLPPFTTEAAADRAARVKASQHEGPGYARGDNPESLTKAERCMKDFGSSSGPPMMPVGYNNTYQLVQTPDFVVILVEMIHDARIVPLAKEHSRPPVIRQWLGDSIGWYEGDTLVVETTNFRPGQAFRDGPENMKLIERFKRVSDKQIVYSFEINDPKVFAAPTRAEIAMNATDKPLYEYACQEGNYSMANMLGGNRRMDDENAKAIAAAAAKRSKK